MLQNQSKIDPTSHEEPAPAASRIAVREEIAAKSKNNLGLQFFHVDRIASEAAAQFVTFLGAASLVALLWAGLTEIDKVTRGSGRIVPQKQKQEVQHLEGGIVTEILVREGERVSVGQPLMRIENTFFRSELAQARIEMAARRLKLIRLEAETSGALTIQFPPELAREMPQAVANETALFRRRRTNLDEQLSILVQQVRVSQIPGQGFR